MNRTSLNKRSVVCALVVAMLGMMALTACSTKYESVEGDPLNARIYTLDNGLKVYLTVNKDEPRIQTFIAVRAGGKNDPSETTGLAHYFEHLMFKGSQQFGTVDYEQEKPMLDEIEALFEVYRTKTDEAERKAIYHQIDSISYEASKLFIPNEYDKLMSAIGANGTNAYTGFDMTVYTEDIPSNQIENWAMIEADRFEHNVIRGFHTELETIYEEKNMSLTKDSRKVYEKLLSVLFPHHPYGQQTVLGTQDHLKNPSITNIKKYYSVYYVPNNMAICMSGDFDPDKTIRIIKKYFGKMKATDGVPALEYEPETPMTAPVEVEVQGRDAEYVTLGWRIPGINSPEFDKITLIDMIFNNGKAGLIDLDLNQQQAVLGAGSGIYDMCDYSAFVMQGYPKQGQTLDQVRALLKAEVDKLKAGDFDDYLLEATINNLKLNQMEALESNEARADMFVGAFINHVEWADQVARLERMSRITKEELVAFANEWLTDGYAVIYKRQGVDPNEKKMAKPEITPILTNRDLTSDFLLSVQQSEVKPIEPDFVDFDKDLTKIGPDGDQPVLYIQNTGNDMFSLSYRYEMGSTNDRLLPLAFEYLNYLGTSKRSAEDFQKEAFRLALDYSFSAGNEVSTISLSGLSEHMPAAMALVEELLSDPQVDREAFKNMTDDIIKSRADSKLRQATIFNRLSTYIAYGPESPVTNVLSNAELKKLTPEDLIAVIKSMPDYPHRVLYYGPDSKEDLQVILDTCHPKSVNYGKKAVPAAREFTMRRTGENKVFCAQYDAKQLYFRSFSNLGENYDGDIEPVRTLFNEYFGGGMNAIVFQEMREARGLAYSAAAGYRSPSKLGECYSAYSYIATQNDKMKDAMEAFEDILNNMPESESAFKLAKDGLEARLRTLRTLRSSIFSEYLSAERMGIGYDRYQKVFEALPSLTLDDVKAFQQQYIKDRTYNYGILGDLKDLDMDYLRSIGPVQEVSLEELFGY